MSTELPALIVLTDMTGIEADAERPVIIGTTEFTRPVALALIPTAIAALVVGGTLTSLAGIGVGLSVALVVAGIVMWLLIGRSRTGLQQRYLRTMRDRVRYTPGEVTLCGQPVDPFGTEVGVVVRSTVPVRSSTMTGDDILSPTNARPHHEVDAGALSSPAMVRAARRAQAHRRGVRGPTGAVPGRAFVTRVLVPGQRMRARYAARLAHATGPLDDCVDVDSVITPKNPETAS